MIPTKEEALKELEIASKMNPGLWIEHSKNVARAAYNIASHCQDMDANKAYVLALLHDIGRRCGLYSVRHIIDGYSYAMEKGWAEVAKICLTYSYPIKDNSLEIGRVDITKEQFDFVKDYLNNIEYDDYDKLVILCDSLGNDKGFCILEKRFIDTASRYGIFPFSLDRWLETIKIKEYFDKKIKMNVYAVLPGIEQCVFN